jgi:hypothetical protein
MASKRAQRRRACKGKVRHEDQATAQRELGRLARSKGSMNIAHLNVYHCRWCGAWHVGHTPARILGQIAARRERQ